MKVGISIFIPNLLEFSGDDLLLLRVTAFCFLENHEQVIFLKSHFRCAADQGRAIQLLLLGAGLQEVARCSVLLALPPPQYTHMHTSGSLTGACGNASQGVARGIIVAKRHAKERPSRDC